MLIKLISYILIFIVLVVLTIDILPILLNWISRLKIGKSKNIKVWNKLIIYRASKWLNKTPKIKVTDNTRLIAIDMIKGNYTKSAIQHWQEGALLLGLGEYLKKS